MNLSELEVLAEKGDNWARGDAARSLGQMGSAAVPLLLRLLSDADPMVRFRAASSLGAIGRDAIVALPRLEELLLDENRLVQTEARRVIGAILDVQEGVRHPLSPEGSDDQWYLLAVAHTGQLFLESQTVWVHERGAVEREPACLWTLQEAEACVPGQIPSEVWEKAVAKARQVQGS